MQPLFCQKISHKTPAGLPEHLHFRLTSDGPIHLRRPSSLPEFDSKSMYMPGLDPPDEVLYQVKVPMPTEKEQIFDDACPSSDELSTEFYMKLELNTLITNTGIRWLLLNHLQIYSSLLDIGILHQIPNKKPA